MEFFNPIAAIGDEKFADRSRIWSIEIDRVAPIVFFFTGQIIVGINAEIISIGAEVVVNHVENYTQAQRVRAIHKGAQIVRRAIQMGRRKQVHAVVSPAKFSWEIRDRHHFDDSDSDARQLCQLFGRGPPRSFFGECADVHFVNDLAFQFDTRPL